jgi:hypothetical protein
MNDRSGAEAPTVRTALQADEQFQERHGTLERTGERKLRHELDPKQKPVPLSPIISSMNDMQVSSSQAAKERGLSSTSWGRSYNFEMNASRKLGRNAHENHYSNSKKSSGFEG